MVSQMDLEKNIVGMERYLKENIKMVKKNGYGIYYFPNGDIEEVEYKNDEINGYIIQYKKNEKIVEGEVKNDMPNGHVIVYLFDGTIFEVELKDSKKKWIWNIFLSKRRYRGS
eukprot:TRINITY_DN9493_c0_g1_i1.p2 TRINITY_DN9493_c0_g1~~TRINITY_DN9493_c0_g1_i1.p2  ORF type:complete len:113 (+),score=31.92 TRINITY_DN9493_c0_g1_i1:206-544(+)